MIQHILRRIGIAIPLIIGSSFITFSILYFVPGDPVIMMLGDKSNDAALVEKLRDELKLNDPFLVRYGRFLAGIARLDFGRSYRNNRDIAHDLAQRFPASAELAVIGVAVAILLGLTSGVISALRQYSALDYLLMVVALAGISIPVFWLALILNHWLAFKLNWFAMAGRLGGDYSGYQPTTGFVLVDAIWYRDVDLFLNGLHHAALPALTLGLIYSALIARMSRSAVLEVRNQDYIRTARAKGLLPRSVLWHTLRNALIPIVTVVGLQFGALLGGAMITEEIFAWPGVGTYLIDSIRYRDIIAVQGTVMAIVLVFIVVNLAVDLLYLLVDPRTR